MNLRHSPPLTPFEVLEGAVELANREAADADASAADHEKTAAKLRAAAISYRAEAAQHQAALDALKAAGFRQPARLDISTDYGSGP